MAKVPGCNPEVSLSGGSNPSGPTIKKENKMLKTSQDWQDIIEEFIMVEDPDGWDRQNFDASWAELITWDEFMERLSVSTCRFKLNGLSWEELLELLESRVKKLQPKEVLWIDDENETRIILNGKGEVHSQFRDNDCGDYWVSNPPVDDVVKDFILKSLEKIEDLENELIELAD